MTSRPLGEIPKLLDSIENENTTYQKFWNTTNAVLRGQFVAILIRIKRIRDLKLIGQ
jgi:hypothetical protein